MEYALDKLPEIVCKSKERSDFMHVSGGTGQSLMQEIFAGSTLIPNS